MFKDFSIIQLISKIINFLEKIVYYLNTYQFFLDLTFIVHQFINPIKWKPVINYIFYKYVNANLDQLHDYDIITINQANYMQK